MLITERRSSHHAEDLNGYDKSGFFPWVSDLIETYVVRRRARVQLSPANGCESWHATPRWGPNRDHLPTVSQTIGVVTPGPSSATMLQAAGA